MKAVDKLHVIAEALDMDIPMLIQYIFMWRYKKMEDVSNDVTLFLQLGVIPEYVEDFLNEVAKKGEKS